MAILTTAAALTAPDPRIAYAQDFDKAIPALPDLLWWCPARPSALSLDGDGKLIDWIDLSGNGDSFSQPTAARRPTFEADQINGHGAVRFEADDLNWMSWGGDLPILGDPSADWTKIALVRLNSSTISANMSVLSATPDERNVLYFSTSGDGQLIHLVGDAASAEARDLTNDFDQWNLVIASYRWDGASGRVRMRVNNDPLLAQSTVGAITNQADLFMGATTSAGNSPLDGQVAMTMGFGLDLLDGAHADTLATVLSYVRQSYGLALN